MCVNERESSRAVRLQGAEVIKRRNLRWSKGWEVRKRSEKENTVRMEWGEKSLRKVCENVVRPVTLSS